MRNVFRELYRVGATVTRKVFTSRAYHAAKSIKERAGCSTENSKKHARDASKKASQMYDKFVK